MFYSPVLQLCLSLPPRLMLLAPVGLRMRKVGWRRWRMIAVDS